MVQAQKSKIAAEITGPLTDVEAKNISCTPDFQVETAPSIRDPRASVTGSPKVFAKGMRWAIPSARVERHLIALSDLSDRIEQPGMDYAST